MATSYESRMQQWGMAPQPKESAARRLPPWEPPADAFLCLTVTGPTAPPTQPTRLIGRRRDLKVACSLLKEVSGGVPRRSARGGQDPLDARGGLRDGELLRGSGLCLGGRRAR